MNNNQLDFLCAKAYVQETNGTEEVSFQQGRTLIDGDTIVNGEEMKYRTIFDPTEDPQALIELIITFRPNMTPHTGYWSVEIDGSSETKPEFEDAVCLSIITSVFSDKEINELLGEVNWES